MTKIHRYLGGKWAFYTAAEGEHGENPSTRFTDPVAHSPDVDFHSEFGYLALLDRQTTEIDHVAVAHANPPGEFSFESGLNTNTYSTTHVLMNHNLGFEPYVSVVVDGEELTVGNPVQYNSSTGVRYVTPIVTTTQVILKEVVSTFGGTLAAVSKSYQAIVLGVPERDSELAAIDIKSDGPEAYFKVGNGAFDSTNRYVRAKGPTETGHAVGKGKTVDLKSGGARIITASGTIIDDDSLYNGSFSSIQSIDISFGDDDEYDGANIVDIGGENDLLIVDQGRVVVDISRKMACILQEVELTNKVFTFPNPAKDYLYAQTRITNHPFENSFNNACDSWVTLVPEEWTQTIELATLDTSDADFLLGVVKGSRTTEPAQLGGPSTFSSINKACPESVSVPVTGAIILSNAHYIRRAISFDIQGNKLVAILQQTIGGYNTSGIFPHNDNSGHDTELPVRHLEHKQETNIADPFEPAYNEGALNGCILTTSLEWGEAWTFTNLKFAIGRIS